MKQVFRLMDMPDKVIAFDELPADLVEGIDMLDCSAMPRYWREFIGVREKLIKIKPELNPITRKIEQFPPVIQRAPFCYVIDREINADKDRWRAIEAYVKRWAPKDFRLTDPIVDIQTGKSTMAKPLAADSHSELSLEPEDVIVIPLEKSTETGDDLRQSVGLAPVEKLKCDRCEKEFEKKRALDMHILRAHENRGGRKAEPPKETANA